MREAAIKQALEKYEKVLNDQFDKLERMKSVKEFVDFSKLDKIIIGACGGDGIGPIITAQSVRVLKFLLKEELESGKIDFRNIDGLTIERRSAAAKAIPDDVLSQIKECHVILKGPTTTPQAGDGWVNVESANVAMRKELDLFANVRPVKVPEEGIDWIFFRENTEGAYAAGSQGMNITDELAIDFSVTTTEGTERIARLAFEYARANGRKRVSVVTKANIIKTTDGKFLNICKNISKEYPEIVFDEWYVDIASAKLIDKKRRSQFEVFILPNLYGDILTDEAAEIQGGVGTAGSANIGKRYAMFEAIHGSAPRMIAEGRGMYADPSSMLRASVLMLQHIGYKKQADLLEKALDICMLTEKRLVVTGRPDGATCDAFGDYVMDTIKSLI